MKIKNSILVILIIVFLILNIYLFVRYQIKRKQMIYRPQTHLTGLKYGEVAPSFTLKDLQGKPHSTDELENKIALLIFCNIEDEKSLLETYYYKLLLGKYKDRGFVVWIISNAKEKLVAKDVNKTYFPILILEDENGKVVKKYCDKKTGHFQVFIVDKEGIIKFRDYNVANLTMRMMVEKFLLAGEKALGEDEFVKDKFLPSLEYYDIRDNNIKKLEELKGRPILLTLFSANCPTCKDHRRLALMRWAYQEYSPKGLKVVLVYGRDNPPSIIRDYAQRAGLSFDVGIRKVKPDKLDDYYQSYDLKVDPKSIIINSEGKVVFVEVQKDNQESIEKKLEDLFREASK